MSRTGAVVCTVLGMIATLMSFVSVGAFHAGLLVPGVAAAFVGLVMCTLIVHIFQNDRGG